MPPISSVQDGIDSLWMNSILFRQGWPTDSLFMKMADVAHLLCIQYMRPAAFSAIVLNGLAAFCNRILLIISFRSEKQMVWPNARRVVAFVTNLNILWNRTVMQFPRNP